MAFHPFTGMAPLKHITVLINLPAFDNFHPFTGMAPLKPGEGANPAGILPHFHPFTGMAPLKRVPDTKWSPDEAGFPSLHRDGPIEARHEKRLDIFSSPNFHPFTGMAPLKRHRHQELGGIMANFHPFTGMAPLKRMVYIDFLGTDAISIPSQGWPH